VIICELTCTCGKYVEDAKVAHVVAKDLVEIMRNFYIFPLASQLACRYSSRFNALQEERSLEQ